MLVFLYNYIKKKKLRVLLISCVISDLLLNLEKKIPQCTVISFMQIKLKDNPFPVRLVKQY